MVDNPQRKNFLQATNFPSSIWTTLSTAMWAEFQRMDVAC